MTERIPLSTLYRECRERVTGLLAAADESSSELPVPATPGWSVHDVVAHLTGVAEDSRDGRLPPDGNPSPRWTAGHVDRGRGVPVSELLTRWAEAAPAVQAALDRSPRWPPVLDAICHEFDLRGALGDTAGRDGDVVRVAAKVSLAGLRPPVPLLVVTEHGEVRAGPDAPDDRRLVLRTTSFEALRWRFGRRSPAQLAAMDWSGDPAPVLSSLCVFGPAGQDVVE